MRNRLRVIPFSVTIPLENQNHRLGDELELEADAVLTWMVDGYLDYLDSGLMESDEIATSTANYHDDNNLIGQAISATCAIEPGIKSEKKAVKSAILSWLKTAGSHAGGDAVRVSEVQAALDDRGHITTRSNGGTWLDGIRVKTQDERNTESSERE